MDCQRRHSHRTGDPERRGPGEKSYDHAYRTQELRCHRQDGQRYWDTPFSGETMPASLEIGHRTIPEPFAPHAGT